MPGLHLKHKGQSTQGKILDKQLGPLHGSLST